MSPKRFQGNPCKRCGATLRYVASKACVACDAAYIASPERKEAKSKYNRVYSATPKARALRRAHRADPSSLAKALLRDARARAKKRSIPFDLHPTPIEIRVRRGFCEVTGLPFDLSLRDKGGHMRPFRPCIDRVDSAKGYTFDNIRVVCTIYNMAKNGFQETDVLTLARALVHIHGPEALP